MAFLQPLRGIGMATHAVWDFIDTVAGVAAAFLYKTAEGVQSCQNKNRDMFKKGLVLQIPVCGSLTCPDLVVDI